MLLACNRLVKFSLLLCNLSAIHLRMFNCHGVSSLVVVFSWPVAFTLLFCSLSTGQSPIVWVEFHRGMGSDTKPTQGNPSGLNPSHKDLLLYIIGLETLHCWNVHFCKVQPSSEMVCCPTFSCPSRPGGHDSRVAPSLVFPVLVILLITLGLGNMWLIFVSPLSFKLSS